MQVRDVMSAPAVTVREDATLEEAAGLMLERRIGCLLVVGPSGRLTGILTESDFAAKERGIPFAFLEYPQLFGRWVEASGVEPLYEEGRRMLVREVMTTDPMTMRPEDTLDDAVMAMMRSDLKRMPVVDAEGVPVGVLARHDLLRLLAPAKAPAGPTRRG